jgi:hypothetical protein
MDLQTTLIGWPDIPTYQKYVTHSENVMGIRSSWGASWRGALQRFLNDKHKAVI